METKRKVRIGHVVSHKMDKTIIVSVARTSQSRLYKKTLRKVTHYKVHDEKNECGEGDIVRIVETRPLSKEKRWRVAEILTKKEAIEIKPQEIT